MPESRKKAAVAPLAPPAPYQGGKRNLARCLVEKITTTPHALYAEPFVGMGGVFFRRRERPRIEVINDLNRELATFFRVLQRHPDAFLAELRWVLPSRAEFDRLRAAAPESLTDLERAARFYLLQRMAYGGKVRGQNFGVSLDSSRRGRLDRGLLRRIHGRLEGVLIESLPYQDFIPRYDRAETLFYLDPPYWNSEDTYGKGAFTKADFRLLAQLLAGIKGRFLLSINDTPEIREIFGRFQLEAVDTSYSLNHKGRGKARGELIVSGPARRPPRKGA